ncbi:MAG: DNA mismatch repair protein MutH [Myxococcales bacterium]|nr:DNA mismatch repair protein MutH [Myxococcales bacterium]
MQEIAHAIGAQIPGDTTRAKGWVGQLVEDALGATAGNRAVPDFEALGIELKTVPVDPDGRPRESTYITILPLNELARATFRTTSLAKKLNRVLFVPVEAHPQLPLSVRRLGSPFLWYPTHQHMEALENDWNQFAECIRKNGVDGLGSHLGNILQIRPKGSDARDRTKVHTRGGVTIETMRRGLYLRPRFVQQLFSQSFHMPIKYPRDFPPRDDANDI